MAPRVRSAVRTRSSGIDPGVSVPYWDWTDANLNAAGTESLIWRNDFMGGPGQAGTGAVTTGPFAGWGLIRSSFNIFNFPGTGGTIAGFMASSNYTTFRQIEGPHGAAHVWVGGFVGDATIAPRDPVFWLIHSNVDRLWAEWIDRHGSTVGFQPFLPLSGGPQGHNLNDLMWPWNGTTNPFGVPPWTVSPESIRPADLLDHRPLGYRYDTIDPECQPIVKSRIKELKDRLPKELQPKERLPKELTKERLPKELNPKERLAEGARNSSRRNFSPRSSSRKSFSPRNCNRRRLRQRSWHRKRSARVPGIDPFIRPELRPDLTGAALGFEPDLNPDIAALRDALSLKRNER